MDKRCLRFPNHNLMSFSSGKKKRLHFIEEIFECLPYIYILTVLNGKCIFFENHQKVTEKKTLDIMYYKVST